MLRPADRENTEYCTRKDHEIGRGSRSAQIKAKMRQMNKQHSLPLSG